CINRGGRRGPFKPVLRRLRNSSAAQEAAKTVESTWRGEHGAVRNSVLIKLADGTVAAIVLQDYLHGLTPFVKGVCAGDHVAPRNIACEPFVPMAVVILLERAVRDLIVVEQRGQSKRSGKNFVGALKRGNLVEVLPALNQTTVNVGSRLRGQRDDICKWPGSL